MFQSFAEVVWDILQGLVTDKAWLIKVIQV